MGRRKIKVESREGNRINLPPYNSFPSYCGVLREVKVKLKVTMVKVKVNGKISVAAVNAICVAVAKEDNRKQ